MEKKEGIKHHVNYMFVYYYNYITCVSSSVSVSRDTYCAVDETRNRLLLASNDMR